MESGIIKRLAPPPRDHSGYMKVREFRASLNNVRRIFPRAVDFLNAPGLIMRLTVAGLS